MERHLSRGWRLLPFILGLLIILLHFGTNFRSATAQPSPGWSRPQALGVGESYGTVILVTFDSGRSLVLRVLMQGLGYTALGRDGAPLDVGELALPRGQYAYVTAVGGEVADTFWVGVSDKLYHAVIDEKAQVIQPPAVLAEGVTDYAARRTPEGLVALVQGAGGLQLYRQSSAAWEPVGGPLPLDGRSVDLQVLDDGTLAAVVHQAVSETEHQLVFLRGNLQEGLQVRGEVHRFTVLRDKPGVSSDIDHVALGVDQTHGYVFFRISTTIRGDRTGTQYVVSGPLDSVEEWTGDPITVPFHPDGIILGNLYNPSAVPGQFEQLKVAFMADTFGRFSRGIGLVVTTFDGGQMTGLEMAADGLDVMRYGLATGPDGLLVAWTTPARGGSDRVYAASSAAPFVERLQQVTGADLSATLFDTLFDIVAAFTPIVQGMIWFAPTLTVVGLIYMFALNWAERSPRRLFWIGVAIAAPLQIYVSPKMVDLDLLTGGMPGFLSTMAVPAAYLGVSGSMLAYVLKVRPPARYTGAWSSLLWWGMSTLLLNGLLFGPLMRRG